MKAAYIRTYAQGPQLVELPEPTQEMDTQNQVLITVEAVGLHRVARARAAGKHYSVTGQLPMVPGIDGVGRTPDGQRIWFFTMGSETNGSLAEKVLVDKSLTVPVPDGLDPLVVAASVNAMTAAWMSLYPRGGLRKDQHLVVLGATGAAGQATLDLARGTAGRVTAVGRRAAALETLVSEGHATDYVVIGDDAQDSSTNGPASVHRVTLDEVAATADVCVDFLWGPVAESLWNATDHRRRPGHALTHVQVGTMAGPEVTLPGALLRGTDLRLVGSAPGAYSSADIMAEMPALLDVMARERLGVEFTPYPLDRLHDGWANESATRTVFDLR